MATPVTPLAGVQPEQGPPLYVPLAFFGLGAFALLVGGGLLVMQGKLPFLHRSIPEALALTHVGTLGFLGAVMIGALYQMVPVVGGAPVPWLRLAGPTAIALAGGTAALFAAFVSGSGGATVLAAALLLALGVTFAGPLGFALATAPTRSPTVWGLRVALAGFAAVFIFGALLLGLRLGVDVGVPGASLRVAHVGLGAFVGVSGLIASVSWKVIPMFYVAPPPPSAVPAVSLAALALALGGASFGATFGAPPWILVALLVPAAGVSLVLHPAVWARQLRRRKRRRPDASLRFWWAATLTGPLAGVVAAIAYGVSWGPVLAAWIFLFGWAGLIAHGMLTRIVPFLVWFHRCAGRVGEADVPSMRQLWPDRAVRVGFAIHVGTLGVGAAAIGAGDPTLARAAGLGLGATAIVIARGIVRALRRAA